LVRLYLSPTLGSIEPAYSRIWIAMRRVMVMADSSTAPGMITGIIPQGASASTRRAVKSPYSAEPGPYHGGIRQFPQLLTDSLVFAAGS
jgi:hypothetical protein